MADWDHIRNAAGSKIKSGVYRITNLSNSKSYVGSTTVTFYRRWKRHLEDLRSGKHHSIPLQRAFDKHTEAMFEFVVLEQCIESECISREQFWMDTLGACDFRRGYNVAGVAGSRLGMKHSKESIEKMSRSHKGKTQTREHVAKRSQARRGNSYPNLSAALKGRTLSNEHRENLKGRVFSDEHRLRLSEAAKKREDKRRQQMGGGGNNNQGAA